MYNAELWVSFFFFISVHFSLQGEVDPFNLNTNVRFFNNEFLIKIPKSFNHQITEAAKLELNIYLQNEMPCFSVLFSFHICFQTCHRRCWTLSSLETEYMDMSGLRRPQQKLSVKPLDELNTSDKKTFMVSLMRSGTTMLYILISSLNWAANKEKKSKYCSWNDKPQMGKCLKNVCMLSHSWTKGATHGRTRQQPWDTILLAQFARASSLMT